MLTYNDYEKIRDLYENDKEAYDLILKIADYALDATSHGCHDLKNHTALISGYCQLLGMTSPQLAANEYIQKIQKSIDNQLALFDEIAAFRYSFRNGEFTPTPLNKIISDAISQTCTTHNLALEKISAVWENITHLTEITCNPNHLTTALCALLTNALEACSAQNNTDISITVRMANAPKLTHINTKNSNNYVEIIVSDNGAGFADEILDTACEPFVTDKKNHAGLGLALASTVAYKHKGDLQIVSSTNGSQVAIILPL